MNVIIVTNHFHPESFRINDVAVALAECGHTVTVLTGTPNYPQGKFFQGYGPFKRWRELWNGILIFRAPLIPRGSGRKFRLMLNYLSYAASSCFMAAYLSLREVDVILVFGTSPATIGLPALVLKVLKKVPVFYWVQDLWPESLSATGAVTNRYILGMVGAMVRGIYRGCDKILVQSEAFSGSLSRHGVPAEKIEYFPNSAETLYRPLVLGSEALERKLMPEEFSVVFAGNIGAAQDFGTILAAAELLRSYDGIKWVIIGDGRMRLWVHNQIHQRKLQENIIMLGHHPIETMPRFFSFASALLVTLRKEPIFALTIPSKLQSYFACAKPVIAALDGEGARIIAASGGGIAVPSENPAALAEAVLTLYNMSKEERELVGQRGRRYFEKNFERNKLISKLDGWMSAAANGGSGSMNISCSGKIHG